MKCYFCFKRVEMKKHSLLFLLTFSVAVTTQAQLPFNVPTQGLVAFYPFNGNVNNAANSQHNGLSTNAVLAQDRTATPASAYSFNGTNASLTLPASVMNQVTGPFSVSLWVKPDTIGRSNVPMEVIADKNTSGWINKFRFGLGAIATGYSADSSCFDAIVSSISVPKVGGPYPHNENWTHYVMVFDTAANGTFRFYHNGQLFSSRINVGFATGVRQINVGRALWPGSGAGSNFYKGLVDDVGIWNRALTNQDITNLFSTCSFLPITAPTNAIVNFGDSAQFSVQATGSGLNYTWQQNTGSGFANILPSSSFAGINSQTLTVYSIQYAQNGHQFRCAVSDTACLFYSAPASLQVVCPAQLLSQPQNTSSFIAGSASFSVAASTGSSFQWQRLGTQGYVNLSNFGQYSGATSATLNIAGLTFANNGDVYRCVVTSNQQCGDTSQSATLQVQCLQQITQGPTNALATTGNTAQFSVTAASSTAFQWQVQSLSSFVNINNGIKYSGATTSTLSVLNTSLVDDGLVFRCIVTALGCADTSQIAQLQVRCAELINQQPRDTVSQVGSGAMFAMQLIPGANYQWFRNSGLSFVQVVDSGQYSGANSHQLYISNLSMANHNSSFACIVSQNECADTSNVVLLGVLNNVSVGEQTKSSVKLYPNPAKDQLTLVLGESQELQHVKVIDLLGRLQFEAHLAGGKHQLSIADWPAGTYLLRVGIQSMRFVVLP